MNKQFLLRIALLAFVTGSAGLAQSNDSSTVIEHVLSVTGVGGVAISPDGSEVAYVLSKRDEKGYGLGSEIHVVSTETGKDRKLIDGGGPMWSPDGSTIAYFSSKSGSRQIWTVPATGGPGEQLTDSEDYVDRFRWEPSSKRIAFLFRRSHEADLRFLTKAPHPLMPIVVDGNNLPMNQLAIIDLATKTPKIITPRGYSVGGYEQWFPDTFSWSPDGERLVFTRRPHAKAGSHLFGEILSVTHRGHAPRRMVEREGMDGHPVWSPDGHHVAFISTERYDWVTVSYLYLVHPTTLERRKITPDFDEKIKDFYWTADSKRILFIAGDRTASQIYSVDIEAAKVTALTDGADLLSGLSVAANADSIAFIKQNATEPPDVYFARLDDMKPKRLTEANPQIKSLAEDSHRSPSLEELRRHGNRRLGALAQRLSGRTQISVTRRPPWRTTLRDDQHVRQWRDTNLGDARLGGVPAQFQG